jgi:hypothetical protein
MISTWADISLIFLIGLSIVMSLVPLAALYFAWRGMRAVNRVLPTKMPKVQSVMLQVHDAVQKGSIQVTEPVIRIKSEWARAETVARAVTGLRSRKPPAP